MASVYSPDELDGQTSSSATCQAEEPTYASSKQHTPESSPPRSTAAQIVEPTTHDAYLLNHWPATPLDPLQGRHFLQQISDPYSGVLGSSGSGHYSLSTISHPIASVRILGGSSYDQGAQDHVGTDFTRDFAEDSRLILGQCANNNFNNEWLMPPEPSAWTSVYDSNQFTHHHNTIGGDYTSFASALEAPSSVPTGVASTTPMVHGPLQPATQGLSGCPHGCRGTFGRPGEYRRHMRKHANPTFFCTQHGCTKSFYRNDKLKDHLRQKHGIVHPRRARGAAAIGSAIAGPATGNQV